MVVFSLIVVLGVFVVVCGPALLLKSFTFLLILLTAILSFLLLMAALIFSLGIVLVSFLFSAIVTLFIFLFGFCLPPKPTSPAAIPAHVPGAVAHALEEHLRARLEEGGWSRVCARRHHHAVRQRARRLYVHVYARQRPRQSYARRSNNRAE